MAVLVVATPCPLILAAPVALVSGLSAAARRGIVVKNGGVLERLARCTTVLLDKTGTLTSGQPAVTAVVPAGSLPIRRRSWASRPRSTRPPGMSWRPRSSARRPNAAARWPSPRT